MRITSNLLYISKEGEEGIFNDNFPKYHIGSIHLLLMFDITNIIYVISYGIDKCYSYSMMNDQYLIC